MRLSGGNGTNLAYIATELGGDVREVGGGIGVDSTNPSRVGFDPSRLAQAWRERDPVKTAACLAARYDASLRTAENWLAGTMPSGEWTARIFEREGPEFLVAVMVAPPRYLREAAERSRLGRIAAERDALARQIARLDAELDAVAPAGVP